MKILAIEKEVEALSRLVQLWTANDTLVRRRRGSATPFRFNAPTLQLSSSLPSSLPPIKVLNLEFTSQGLALILKHQLIRGEAFRFAGTQSEWWLYGALRVVTSFTAGLAHC